MVDPSMAGETRFGLSRLFFAKTVASVTRVALTILPADGMTAPTPFLRIDHLRREFQDLLEAIHRGPRLGMLTRFEPLHLTWVTSFAEASHHEACSDCILGGLMVAPMAIDTCDSGLAHGAFPPGPYEPGVGLLMATDADSVILLGGNAWVVQREKGQEKCCGGEPTAVTSPFHRAPFPVVFETNGVGTDYT
jgi:hypothetical protein